MLKELNEDLKVPSLSDFGIEENAFRSSVSKMAVDAIASGSPNNNPVIPNDTSDVEALYTKIWESGL